MATNATRRPHKRGSSASNQLPPRVVGFDIETKNLGEAGPPNCNRVYSIVLYDLQAGTANVHDARRKPANSVSHTEEALAKMHELVDRGYTIAGYNSLGFDFRMLHSALTTHKSRKSAQAMAALVLDHVDIAYHRWVTEGYATSLEAHARATLNTSKNGCGADVQKAWAAAEAETDVGRADAIYDSINDYCAMAQNSQHSFVNLG